MTRAIHAIVGVPVSVRVVPEGPMRLHGASETYIRAVRVRHIEHGVDVGGTLRVWRRSA